MKRLLAMVFVALFVLGGCSNAKTFTGEKINEGVEHNYACPTFGFFADGERLFFRFHQHDKALHAWYYRSCAALLKEEMGNTLAWQELSEHIAYVFADIP